MVGSHNGIPVGTSAHVVLYSLDDDRYRFGQSGGQEQASPRELSEGKAATFAKTKQTFHGGLFTWRAQKRENQERRLK
jgi:hypothetical protein